MSRVIRRSASWRLLFVVTLPVVLVAQAAAPTDPSRKVAPPGTAVAPSRSAGGNGGQRPPTDAAGRIAPAGTPVAPTSLASPNSASSSAGTTRP